MIVHTKIRKVITRKAEGESKDSPFSYKFDFSVNFWYNIYRKIERGKILCLISIRLCITEHLVRLGSMTRTIICGAEASHFTILLFVVVAE